MERHQQRDEPPRASHDSPPLRQDVALDFRSHSLVDSTGWRSNLPDTVFIQSLERMLRDRPLSPIQHLLSPRFKRPLGHPAPRRPGQALRADAARLKRFIRDKDLPIRFGRRASDGAIVLESCEVATNISRARETAKHARQLSRQSKGVLASESIAQALMVDPDCVHAAAIVVWMIRQGRSGLSNRAATLATVCLTRQLLWYETGWQRLSAARQEDRFGAEARSFALRRIEALRVRLQLLWAWNTGQDPDGYRRLLRVIGEVALQRVKTATGSDPDAFEVFLELPKVRRIIEEVCQRIGGRSGETQAAIRKELPVRLFRLIWVDGYLPAAESMAGFTREMTAALLRRVRTSNLPDHATRSRRQREFRDDLHETEQSELDPDDEDRERFESDDDL